MDVLPRAEHFFEDSYIELNTLLDTSLEDSIIGMYSFLMLPLDLFRLRKNIRKIKTKNLKIYFVYENSF